MIYCNFSILDEPFDLGNGASAVLSVDDVHIYSQILYSLYQQEHGLQPDYPFLLFGEEYQDVKNIALIQNPLTFDFNTSAFKKLLFNRIIATLDMEERQRIESEYAELVQYFNQQIFEDIEIQVSISEAYKLEELFKLLKIDILDNTTSIFEKSQLILNVFHELTSKDLIIFCGLGNMITVPEFNLIIETAELNQQKVLFIENQVISGLKNAKQIHLDKDYFLTEKML